MNNKHKNTLERQVERTNKTHTHNERMRKTCERDDSHKKVRDFINRTIPSHIITYFYIYTSIC